MKRFHSWIRSVPFVSNARRRRGSHRTIIRPVAACTERLEPRTLLSGTPSLSALGEVELLAGSPLYIPLNGSDPDGQPLTYTVTSDSSLVSTYVPEGNRSMRISVAGYGEMVFELFEDKVPRVTNQIIQLADMGYYDGVTFHRIIDGAIIQGGDRTGTGGGGSVLGDFDDQYHVDLQHNRTGLLSMAKTYDDTNDSQFFITEGAQRHLDFQHSIFGLLVEGEDVREEISGVETDPDPNSDRPLEDVVMENVTIFEDTQNGVVMLKAAEGASGTANITVTVTDPDGNSSERTFRVIVEPDPVNSSPFLADIPQIVTFVDTEVTFALEAIDVEGGLVGGENILFFDQHVLNYYGLYVPVQAPQALDYFVNYETGLVTVTPTDGLVGDHQITVAIFDDVGSLDYQVVDIRILGDLSKPELIGPPPVTIDTTPLFEWTEVQGAVQYDIWVNDLTTGQSGIIRKVDVEGTQFVPTEKLVPGHEYIWTVTGMTASGDRGEWAVHRRFRVAAPGDVAGPTPTGPGATIVDATPTFRWTPVPGAARYEVWVNDLTTGKFAVVRNAEITATEFTPTTPMKAGHLYLFAVRAFNDEGVVGEWGSQQTFAIAAAPNIQAPLGRLADSTPTFEWSAVPGAAGYILWVNDVTTGQYKVIYETAITENRYTPQAPLTGGHRYVWTVQAYDAEGETGEWAVHGRFHLSATLINPVATTIDATPTFKWTPVEGAARYDLWVNDLSTGQSGIIRETNLTEATYTPSQPLPVGHQYIWTVRAIGSDDTASPWSVHERFYLASPTFVGPPAVLSGNGMTPDTTPTFEWEPIPGAHRYDLWVNDLTTGQSGIIREPDLSGPSYTPSTPLPLGHRYIWTVRAFNDDGVPGEWAPHDILTIQLEAPEPKSPLPVTTDATPTFEWTPVEGAVRYDIWVNNLSTGQSGIIRNANVTSSQFVAPFSLTTNHRYIWTVRAFNEDGVPGDWAPHRTFIVGKLDAPQRLSPGSFTIDTTPTFEWTDLDGAVRYDLWVNNLSTGQSGVIRNADITETRFTSPIALTPGHRYIWTVTGINDDGVRGEWATHGIVTITPMDAPEVTSPGSTTTHTKPIFEWSTVEGADHFELEVHDVTSGESHVIHETGLTGTMFVSSSSLVVDHKYEWRMRAIDADGAPGRWTPLQEFTLTVLEAPELLAPGETADSVHPEFRWSEVDSAVRYDLWVNDLTTGQSQVIRVTQLTRGLYRPPVALVNGHRYIWTVRAFNSNGDPGEWAPHQRFTIQVSQVDEGAGGSSESAGEATPENMATADVPIAGVDEANVETASPARQFDTALDAQLADETQHIGFDLDGAMAAASPRHIAGETGLLPPHDAVMEAWTRTEWWALDKQGHEAAQAEVQSSTPSNWRAGALAVGIPSLVVRWFRRNRNRTRNSLVKKI